MIACSIATVPGFEEWRAAARLCLARGVPPERVLWRTDAGQSPAQDDLFAGDDTTAPALADAPPPRVPAGFVERAALAACHRDPDRFTILYRVLWRLVHEDPRLLRRLTDPDILALERLVSAVRRDAYKMTAFLRFRSLPGESGEHFIAWYEPEHYTLELKLDFFTTRFRNMMWTIMTPYRAAHWDGKVLTVQDTPDPSACPDADSWEAHWLTYYASTFNPARVMPRAMRSQMPRKYWKNMPETALVEGLVRGAGERVRRML